MHQSLLAYAGGLNQTTRGEWRKVGGRFRHIQFLEDSRELYALIANVVASQRPSGYPAMPEGDLHEIASRAVNLHWFDSEQDTTKVERILAMADPVTAGALQVLPRVVARVGQNERSLFSFVNETELDETVGTLEVYDAFSDTMRTDIGIGGTHRRWVETENARSRTDGHLSHEALTAACLFQLGTDGERRRLTRQALELALASRHGCSITRAADTVQLLIDRKLLIHRKSHDDISIWFGTDVDLATRIRDYCASRRDSFDLTKFLDQHRPAPFVRPSRHNEQSGVARYLAGRYVTAEAVVGAKKLEDFASSECQWGTALYVVPHDVDSLAQVKARVTTTREDAGLRLVFVVPDRPLSLNDSALEVEALLSLRRDDVILGEDPLVSQEIDDLLAVARGQLETVLGRLVSDRSPDTSWFADGQRLDVTPESPAGVATSRLMDDWYPLTPSITNDQLMRTRLSRQMRTARVRLILRIMENAGQRRLGYSDGDRSAEASLYRTVLRRTGLHISDERSTRFANPDEISDCGLRRCWAMIQHFFQAPSTAKPLAGLVKDLTSPPYGMPLGVLPVIVMAGYRAFARAVSVQSDGKFVEDLLGFKASHMFDEPDRHTVTVHKAEEATTSYLAGIAYVLSHTRPSQGDEHVRFASDALNVWIATVPRGAWHSSHLSENARSFFRILSDTSDPGDLFLLDLPRKLGGRDESERFDRTIQAVESVRNEVDRLIEGYVDLAVEVIQTTLSVESEGDAVARVGSWVGCLNVDQLLCRRDLRMTDKAVLRTARDTLNGRYTPQSLARRLSSILLQQGCEQWRDSTLDRFRLVLRECKHRIEDAALFSMGQASSIAPLVRARIRTLKEILSNAEVATPDEASKLEVPR